MAQKVAQVKGARKVVEIDREYRLTIPDRVAEAETINFEEEDPIERIREMTDGSGADVCVDAVGLEANQLVPGKTGSLLRLQSGNINALKRAVDAAESLASLASTGQRTTNSRLDRFSTKALVCDLARPPFKSTWTN